LLSGAQIVAAILIVLLGVFVLKRFEAMRKAPEQKKEPDRAPVVRVVKVAPSDERITVRADGIADFTRRVEIRAQVGGKVVQVSPSLKEGERLRKGELLIKIEQTDYVLAARRAQADVEIARAALARLRLDESSQGRQIKTLREDLKLAEAEMRRAADLLRRSAGSQSRYDAARRTYLQGKNVLQVAENALAVLAPQIQEREARFEQAKVRLEQARVDLARTEITCPFDALVVTESVEVGQVLQANQDVAVLGDESVMEIRAILDLSDLRRLPLADRDSLPNPGGLGMRANVIWKGLDERLSWLGKVNRMGMVDPETRTVPLVVEVSRPAAPLAASSSGRRLLAGMYCQVEIEGNAVKGVFVIPRNAVREGNRLFVEKDGKLRITRTRIVYSLEDWAIVDEGLAPGDNLVLSSLQFPVDGMRVKPVAERGNSMSRENAP